MDKFFTITKRSKSVPSPSKLNNKPHGSQNDKNDINIRMQKKRSYSSVRSPNNNLIKSNDDSFKKKQKLNNNDKMEINDDIHDNNINDINDINDKNEINVVNNINDIDNIDDINDNCNENDNRLHSKP